MQKKYAKLRIDTCNKGVAFIEFALCVPFLLIVFLGAVEVSRYFLAIQKVEKTIDLVADTVTRADMASPSEMLTDARMASIFSTIPSMMVPYEFGANGVVILTSITQPFAGGPIINWQYCGGGTLAKTSVFGTSSGDKMMPNAATLPATFSMAAGEEVVVGEIYYQFSPILLQNIIGQTAMSRIVYFIPRLGSLSSYNAKCS